jgi:Polyketide cyclase / dehydrase and lipid transport
MAADYHFETTWRLPARIEQVAEILADPEGLARWWPSVYLDVKTIEPGGPDGVGRRVQLLTKGALPYKLRWEFVVTENRSPHGFSLEAKGDLVGRGVWNLTQEGETAVIHYDWRVRADKPLLRAFTPLLRPVFSWNHRWAMEQGERSLRAELARRYPSG